jgi:hypothetical protein
MGAWGVGVFEDDTSLDWLDEAYSDGGLEAVRAALKAVAEKSDDDYLEYDEGIAGRAAAEIVAMSHGLAAGGLNDGDEERAKEHVAAVRADASLPALALEAIERLTGANSELHELWTEDPTNPEWGEAISDLKRRLKRGKP